MKNYPVQPLFTLELSSKAVQIQPLLRLLVYVMFGSIFTFTVQAQELTHVPVEVQIKSEPITVQALGRNHLVYELHLTHFGNDSLIIETLDIFDADQPATPISSMGSVDLANRFRIVGSEVISTNPVVLPPGVRAVIYQWVTLNPGASVPDTLYHEFVFGTRGDYTRENLHIFSVPVSGQTPIEIAVPVLPGRWVAVRGPSNGSGHRRSFTVHDAKAHIPERFAVDWVRLGTDGRFFDGDPRELYNWYSYNQPVHAVTEGRIVLVRDNLPENQPLSEEIGGLLFTPETVAGNTVVIDMGGGNFAVYAHLQPGTIQVNEGDQVKVGQVLGRIGNSGHSLAPHLHFHVQDTEIPLAGEGVPFVHKTFELIGQVDSIPLALQGSVWKPHPARTARTVFSEMPLENMVIEIQEESSGTE